MPHPVLVKSVLLFITLVMLVAKPPGPQLSETSIPIRVNTASLPITIGVPFGEDDKLFDATQLGIADASGTTVATQTRVLARWRGRPDESNKPVKWLLVDFKPLATGVHYLVRSQRNKITPVAVSDTAGILRITNSQLAIEFSKPGDRLIRSFKLDDKEMLRDPMTIQLSLPPRAIIAQLGKPAGMGPDTIIVTDPSQLSPGDKVRFEHTDSLKWDSAAGTARIVTNDQNFVAGRLYRLSEGTQHQEEIEIKSAQPGDLQAATMLKYAHAAGSAIRDLNIEQEAATIKQIRGQIVQFTEPLKITHTAGEKLIAPDSANTTATAVVERTAVEEANDLRVVVRQDGYFNSRRGKTPPMLSFTIRYYIYAAQPFIRTRLRVMNNGAYGFGASRTMQEPFAQHALIRNFSLSLPTTATSSGKVEVLNAIEAHARIAQKESIASISAGSFEIAVPEFAENFPRRLQGSSEGMRFDVLPDLGSDHVFDGARSKTIDFYLGRETVAASALTNSSLATLDPGYVATTEAVRPAFVEKRNWAAEYIKDPQLGEAAARVERMFASAYAVEASEAAGPIPPMSIFEYRQRSENGEQFGWRNFGDLAWGDGYANVHYDLPFILLREHLRTGDERAFRLGGEMARYRADWGQYQADDYIDREHKWNLKGQAFYEKGDHGSFREPVPSHEWIEGMWLYWALTGDEAAHESALAGSEAFARMNFTFANALSWNEPRWVGWPVLGLMVAYRYSGDNKYLNKARANINLFLQAEETNSRKGYYLNRAPDVIQGVQPWAWCYSLLGVIEYWRDTRDERVAGFLVRVADWLVGKRDNPPLKSGTALVDGNYIPAGVPYFWYPDKRSEDRSVALAGLCLPVLTTAARISNRMDLWAKAGELFRHFAFYRDLPEDKSVQPSSRGVINFRSPLFAATVPKVYGEMGLTVSDYLPELTFHGPTPRLKPNETMTTISSEPEPAPPKPSYPVVTTTKTVNVAFKRPAMASSVKTGPDIIGYPSAANDGERVKAGKFSVWQSDFNRKENEWWQVDLRKGYRISSIEIFFREDKDQVTTRRNFEVCGSNDLNFETTTVLASQGKTPIQFNFSFQATVNDTGSYRYIRVRKTKIDPDDQGQSYFNLVEVRINAQVTEVKPAQPPKRSPSSKGESTDKQ
jgi:F5/8 type C domain-containing protein/exo-rhamnogalacturonan lyase-like protein